MSSPAPAVPSTSTPRPAHDWVSVVRDLGPSFAGRAERHDAADAFVKENYEDLRERGVFAAGVPAELGGGGASYGDLCAMLGELARHCGSTALALSMHTHLIAVNAWRWRHEGAPTDGLLRRVAAERLALVSSGGSDWLPGSGTAERVEGGFRITARKVFSSGSPAGQLLVTSAVYVDEAAGPTVLHFAVPLAAPGVRIEDTWRTMGMRATGSHDVVIDGVFVPEAAIGVRRPAGKWHPLFHTIASVAFPLIYAVYVGVAGAARDLAVAEARKKKVDTSLLALVGEMENELAVARLGLRSMIENAASARFSAETTHTAMTGRSLAGRHAIRTVEKAMEVVGGASFFRSLGLERMFRDVQGARFHPLQEKPQLLYAGRMALALDVDG
jgi:alkylation response protein AidB-like acyl-CoA dehydrogenase